MRDLTGTSYSLIRSIALFSISAAALGVLCVLGVLCG